jgi:hypothetical protein
MSQVMDHLEDVGPGWHKILFQLHYDLVKLNPSYEVVQVKEKFGGLRVYLRDEPSDVAELLSAAEVQSWATCELCGEPGKLYPTGTGWIKAVCDRRRMEGICGEVPGVSDL